MFGNKQRALLLALCVFFVVFSVLSISGKSLTTDESRHYQYGVNILDGKAERFDDSKMPFSALNALPGKIASRLPDGPIKAAFTDFLTARLMTILFSVAVALLIFVWTRSLYGVVPAFFALTLYIFDPNIIAHSQLVTTDIYATGAILFAFYSLWRFARQRTWPNGLLCAFALGLSQVAKYTSVALFALFLLVLVIYDLPSFIDAWKQNAASSLKVWLPRYALYVGMSLIVSLLVINVCFLFDQTFTRFGSYNFRSDVFQTLQAQPLLRKLPIPTPYPYLQGLDWVMQRNDAGFPVYFLGHIQNHGVPGYYFVAFLLKELLATQLLIIAALIAWLRKPERRRMFFPNGIFLLAPLTFFVIYFNFFYDTQIGLRYYLVIFPFLYIFAASLFVGWQSFSAPQKWTSAALLAALAVSTLSYYPYYIPYFNELVWDRTQSYKYLADSNLEWHQSYDEAMSYLSQHPDAQLAPGQPQAGHFIISANGLVGLAKKDDRKWLRENFEPDGTIGYSYLIYHISPEELKALCAKTKYCSP